MTTLSTVGERFLINDHLTYSEIPGSSESVHGLLFNARFIQGIFDDRNGRGRYARFGVDEFEPEANTDRLIGALPDWYRFGLRAFTVVLQGGMPAFTTQNELIDNNPYSSDGSEIDAAYLRRLDRLIEAADALGMVVIVSLLYQGQCPRMRSESTIRNAVATASRHLRELGRSNVLIEVANEHNIGEFRHFPLVYDQSRVAELIDLARRESGGMPVGCSSGGKDTYREIASASDVILIHGNGTTRQQYHNQIAETKGFGYSKPIVCNEDSPCIGQLAVAFSTQTSWGYYNNFTKQEPPAVWGVTPGEDTFFARRMAIGLGIEVEPLDPDQGYYFQGFEKNATVDGKRWLRVAAEYPETIDTVEFIHDGKIRDRAWDEPFFLYSVTNWIQRPIRVDGDDAGEWTARIHLRDGRTVERYGTAT